MVDTNARAARLLIMSLVENQKSPAVSAPKRNHVLILAFLLVASLFFIWGFCHSMLEVLNKHFQNILPVSKTQSGFIQTSVFGAYFLLALPSAQLIRRMATRKASCLAC
jgi:MFS transporter, FHS family, L-fucose permease